MKEVPDIMLLCVGAVKDRHIAALIDRYLARLRREARIEVREIADSNPKAEEERLCGIIDKTSGRFFALSEEGRSLTSTGLASLLKTVHRRIVFIVGGPGGLSRRVKEKAGEVLSLSSFTFTHEIARLLLIEQLYRGCSILRHGSYHKW